MRKSKEFNPMDLHDLDLLEELQKLQTKDLDKEQPTLGVAFNTFKASSPIQPVSKAGYQGGDESQLNDQEKFKKEEEKAQIEALAA